MSRRFERISKCRICGESDLVEVLNLGVQALTGVFPSSCETSITSGPLILLKCQAEQGCGLVQLAHNYDPEEMYGSNYGYRSGLNASMIAHLRSKVEHIKNYGIIEDNSIILDIGSNDGTTLNAYDLPNVRLIGIDPTADKFCQYYKKGIHVIPDFFSADKFHSVFGDEKARIVTSFSMFYDMEDPVRFMQHISDVLDDNGIWVCEQSYMPLMLETKGYDTVCHEHLEYYALAQIFYMAERTGLNVVDVELNDVNGGSFSFIAQKKGGALKRLKAVDELFEHEKELRLNSLDTYRQFAQDVEKHRDQLLTFLNAAKNAGKRVVALGASTKGNVILQYCGIDSSLIEAIGEVNPEKFGCYAPGTQIPIVDEAELLATRPDYILVLPWHFRKFFEAQARYAELNLVFPLPELSVY